MSDNQPTFTHSDLVALASGWLRKIGCAVVASETVCINDTGETPDAIGWRSGVSILVEAKCSRADFLRDRKKNFRRNPPSGMGEWRVYLTPPGLLSPDELPEGWGLIEPAGKRMRRVCGLPKSNQWSPPPFEANLQSERALLCSLIRRQSE